MNPAPLLACLHSHAAGSHETHDLLSILGSGTPWDFTRIEVRRVVLVENCMEIIPLIFISARVA